MPTIQKYRVVPSLPPELHELRDLTYNLYWTWDHDTQSLFHRIDPKLSESVRQNPVLLLGSIEQKRLEALAADEGFLAHLSRVADNLKKYLARRTWFKKNHGEDKPYQIAYFSMEYGLAKGLPIYSGGLGVLAADHLKSASDLGLPLVGVGLLYQQGYFNQYLAKDGWQQETYPKNDFYNMPLQLERAEDGSPLRIDLDFAQRNVTAQIWRVQVGGVPLYLLDTNLPENSDEDKVITNQLYGGDQEMRIKQEILLGIGGIRSLRLLGHRPEVCHMNEGHSAFMALERIRILMDEKGLSFNEALEATRGGNIFTSHTPVPAGIDKFDTHLVDRYLGPMYEKLKINQKHFHHLGGVDLNGSDGLFNMAIFAINMAGSCNGVSRLHGRVARKMWNYLWPDLPEHEVPIGHVTNGVHIRTWLSEDMAELYERYLGPAWYEDPVDQKLWRKIQPIPDEELWRAHTRSRSHLVTFARTRLQRQMRNSGASAAEIQQAAEVLNPEALTIGFARRFAQYKRAYLLFSDLNRLNRILNNKERPVQIILAGKAHPRDNIGKGIIRDIINIIRREEFRHNIVFIEDYDMEVAANLVHGVDIWLNTPRRPREASGTSGMKAAANGALNLSILDGWWEQAYRVNNGWCIGRGEEYADLEEQDRVESEMLYHLLEHDVIPLFFQNGGSGLPREWIHMMKNSIQHICPYFNTNRMVRTYFQNYYLPAVERWTRLTSEEMRLAKTLARWRDKVDRNWARVHILEVKSDIEGEVKVGDRLRISVLINIDGLKTEDVRVEVYYGQLDDRETVSYGRALAMTHEGEVSEKVHQYQTEVPCEDTGLHGFSIRIMPHHPELTHPHETGLVTWYTN